MLFLKAFSIDIFNPLGVQVLFVSKAHTYTKKLTELLEFKSFDMKFLHKGYYVSEDFKCTCILFLMDA